jgi:hypothetical protein
MAGHVAARLFNHSRIRIGISSEKIVATEYAGATGCRR